MIPLKDDAPRISTPFVNFTLIALNTIAFLYEISLNSALRNSLVFTFGVVPARLTVVLFNHGYVPWDLISGLGTRYVPTAAAIIPVFTSMFLHGGWLHLIFNMWALWIFGDNVEDYLGHWLYLVLYLVCGVAAALLHTLFNIGSTVPSVGASGAIAGVMGAFFVLYPRRACTDAGTVLLRLLHVAAGVDRAWLLVRRAVPERSRNLDRRHSSNASGIAFWAHVGGFIAGVVLIKLFPARTRRYHYGL